MIKTWILGASAIAMTAMPVAATAAPVGANSAGSLSLAPSSLAPSVRAGTSTKKSSKLAGASIVPIIIGVGIVAGVTYLIIDHEDDNSDSN